MHEFKLIQQKFLPLSQIENQSSMPINLGIGDDCAVFAGNIAISHDTLNEGVHFFSHANAKEIAHKAFAVNLSDLAAMSAKPIGFLLALSLPTHLAQNNHWINIFSQTLSELAQKHHCPLIGGDTTRTNGTLSIGISILGQIPEKAPYRHAAKAGDDIWITGALGQARLAVEHTLGRMVLTTKQFLKCQRALYQPPARIDLMQELAPFIHSAIDISDGLMGDIQHILQASQLSAKLWVDQFEVAPALSQNLKSNMLPSLLLNAGDDYEICFTAPKSSRQIILNIAQQHHVNCHVVGECLFGSSDDVPMLQSYYFGKQLNDEDLNFFAAFQHF